MDKIKPLKPKDDIYAKLNEVIAFLNRWIERENKVRKYLERLID